MMNSFFYKIPVFHYSSLDSTNNKALECAKYRYGDFLIFADSQSAGRGRMGRVWCSPHGRGLYFSLACSLPSSVILSYFFAVLVNHALSDFLKHDCVIQFKWPNDLFFLGKKVGGILIEHTLKRCIVGIGVNIAEFEGDRGFEYSFLNTYFTEYFSVLNFLKKFIDYYFSYLNLWKKSGFSKIADLWMSRALFLGETQSFYAPQESRSFQAVFHGIDSEGNLLLESSEISDMSYSLNNLTLHDVLY